MTQFQRNSNHLWIFQQFKFMGPLGSRYQALFRFVEFLDAWLSPVNVKLSGTQLIRWPWLH
jgi:hypothetical protein